MTSASENYNRRIQRELKRADYDRGFNCRMGMGNCGVKIDSVAIKELTVAYLKQGGQIKKLDKI